MFVAFDEHARRRRAFRKFDTVRNSHPARIPDTACVQVLHDGWYRVLVALVPEHPSPFKSTTTSMSRTAPSTVSSSCFSLSDDTPQLA
jgi:hypothetical protein